MPANNKKNAFFYFVLEMLKKSGSKMDIKDACKDPEISDKWKHMSEHEKAKYKAMEKTAKPNQKKRTGLGEDLSELERERMREKQFADDMREYITNKVITSRQENRLQYMMFYVIHCNYYYKRIVPERKETEFCPAEICIIECNIQEGIRRVYLQHVTPKIKIGYSAEARTHSDSTHNIPVAAHFGDKTFKEMYEDICKFIMPGKEGTRLPPLFTLRQKLEICSSVTSIMDQLAEAAGEPTDLIRIYSLEDLFASIYNASLDHVATTFEPLHAQIELSKDPYCYVYGIQCDYHTALKGGMPFCSQSFVKRWFFLICDFVCQNLNVVPIQGVHAPPKVPIETSILNSSMKNLTMNDSKRATSSMSDISLKVKQRIAEKNNKLDDEKEISIIMHTRNDINEKLKTQEPVERPLRTPYTRSAGYHQPNVALNQANFPELGQKKRNH
ncbi:hypothetical protein TKK_0018825 [Trichogramma kaykai]|uniref:HMG box domain-containing protein n=1 Tax=Trichogramma kaykai TaxID=54128 RepID=A0ABD2VWA0_9HYME